jgi:ABC-type branched-subunit amino acid transport system ATPase component
MSTVEVRELTVRAPGAALRRAELTVRAGEVVLLAGEPGGSTLVRTVAGLVAPAAGAVRVEGVDLTAAAYPVVAAQRVALVPARWQPYAGLNAREHLRVGSWGDGVAAWAPACDEPRALAVAVALARRPRVLLVDGAVPLAALGAIRAARVTALVADPAGDPAAYDAVFVVRAGRLRES